MSAFFVSKKIIGSDAYVVENTESCTGHESKFAEVPCKRVCPVANTDERPYVMPYIHGIVGHQHCTSHIIHIEQAMLGGVALGNCTLSDEYAKIERYRPDMIAVFHSNRQTGTCRIKIEPFGAQRHAKIDYLNV